MRRTKAPRQKSQIVGIDLKVHRKFVSVYVRRRWPGDEFAWKVHLKVTPATLRRLARLTENILGAEHETRTD